ncbi:MAG: hypothetical protein INQ03_06390 [Candidatus Heimdallarchaeota archaeon]|nr:hypothetical protein [Candidatus Heimdallarchaeota archaeon]
MSDIIFGLIFTPVVGIILSILLLPLLKEKIKWIGLLGITVSGLVSAYIFVMQMLGSWEEITWSSKDLIPLGGSNILEVVINGDPLGIFMSFIASFLGMLIAIFSASYMNSDTHEAKYWIFLQLFIVGMDLLVLAGDFVLLFVGWETVGLCSFALISHYYYKPGPDGRKAAAAGIKAFVFTHLADAGFLVALVLIYNHIGSLVYNEVMAATGMLDDTLLFIIGISLFISAIGKSALFPFTPWLSSPEHVDIDAMQGPTTVSALIHAATMVKAGVYMVSRLFLIFPLHRIELLTWIIIIIPALTAVITAMSAVVSVDLKRILAYSTVSQLSYMFMAVGLSIILSDEEVAMTAFLSGQFHLVSHAFFKSLLFLTAGYLIHGWHSRSILELKGVASWGVDKVAFIGILFGSLSLSGIVPFIGFFSKETIIGVSYEAAVHLHSDLAMIVLVASVLTAFITAIYCGKMIYYLILAPIGGKGDNHGSILMQSVIVILSLICLTGGVLMLWIPDYFADYGHGVLGFGTGDELIMSISISVVVIIVLLVSISTYRNEKRYEKLSSNLLVTMVAEISKQGFWIDWLWSSVWYQIKRLSYGLRRIHSGDLNITMFMVAMMSFSMTLIIVGVA